MIGEKIRETRLAQQRSLADVARKAKISVATLSRIETDKQTLDVKTLMILARVLKADMNDLLGTGGNGSDEGGRHRTDTDQLATQVDAVLAQIELLRHELESVKKRLRRR